MNFNQEILDSFNTKVDRHSKAEIFLKTFWYDYCLLYIDVYDDQEICGWYIARVNLLGQRKILCSESFSWYILNWMKGCAHNSKRQALDHFVKYQLKDSPN